MTNPTHATIKGREKQGEFKVLRYWSTPNYSSYQLEETINNQKVNVWYPDSRLNLIKKADSSK